MVIKLPREVQQRLIASIKRYCAEMMGDEIGDLKASLFLDYCLEEIGAVVYNQAIADAQAFMQDRVADLDSTCFMPEFGYWRKQSKDGT